VRREGYPLRVVSSDAFASEKLRTMQAFGAEVELISSPAGITPQLIPAMVRRAREIATETGAFGLISSTTPTCSPAIGGSARSCSGNFPDLQT
jgi:cysteine synthase